MTRYTSDSMPSTIAELTRTAELRWKDGKDIVVAVKDAGHGPAVDVRTYITPDAYPSAVKIEDENTWRKSRGMHAKRTKEDGYVGPTRDGWWLSDLDLAERIGAAILEAVEAARLVAEGTVADRVRITGEATDGR